MKPSVPSTLSALPQVTVFSRRVATNSFWLLLARLSSQLLLFLFSALVARSLGEAGLGQYAFISALVFLANVLTTFGTDTLLIREVASRQSSSQTSIAAALWLQLSLSALFIAGFSLIASRLPGKTPETALSLQIYALSLLPQAFTTVFSAVLRGQQRMDRFLLLSLCAACTQVLAAVFLFSSGSGLLALSRWLVMTQFFGALFAYGLTRRYLPEISYFWKVSLDQVLWLVRTSWPLALLAGLGIAYQRFGLLLLSFVSGDAATGWFSAAARITEGFKLLHIALLGALFPMLVHLTSQPKTAREDIQIHRTAFFLLMSCVLLIVLFVQLFSPPLINAAFGLRYAPSSIILRVLALSLIPYTYVSLVSLRLVARGGERWVVFGLGLTLITALPLNLSLIHRLGSLGAGWAAVGSELFQAVILGIIWRRTYGKTAAQSQHVLE